LKWLTTSGRQGGDFPQTPVADCCWAAEQLVLRGLAVTPVEGNFAGV